MHRTLATLLLTLAGGCSIAPAGIVLIFPNAKDKSDAAQATLIVVTPPAAPGDLCGQYTSVPPLDPQSGMIETMESVALTNGASSSPLTQIPVGRQTLLVKVNDKTGTIFLHGCVTTTINSGSSLPITLKELTATDVDMATALDAAVDMASPPDMAKNKFLSITVNELRASTRKLSGVVVTVTDSAGTVAGPATTDANGLVKINTLGLVPPLAITGSAPLTNGYQGAVTLSGVTPTFVTDTVAITMPVDLDPPPMAGANAITVTVSNPPTGTTPYDLYWLGANELASDFTATSHHSTTTGSNQGVMQPLVLGEDYRLAVVETGLSAVATPSPIEAVGFNFTPSVTAGMAGDFKSYATAGAGGTSLTLSVTHSTNAAYTSQSYGVLLMLPASTAQAPIPIIPDATFMTTAAQAPVLVPTTPSTIQGSAVLETEVVAVGTAARAEIRHQLTQPTPASDTLAAVADPPVVTPASPATEAAATPFMISAIPPSGFGGSGALLHVHIHNAGNTYHWHLVAPATNPTTITVPANVIPAGMYTMDVAFVQEFTPLGDGTVQATLTDDYSRLLRPVPQALSQSSITLTVN